MLYMLDTNICIYLMKKKPLSYFKKLAVLEKQHTIVISSIVLAELQYGVANSQYKEQSQINLNLLLSRLDVLPYTDQCAFYYGEIRAELKRNGNMIGANDLLIASHALTEKAILVTNNSSEFKRISGIKIENWHE
ncbi:MAG: type II toxin-antitoxin system VapC family toxin [Gammaproteobacteria bacterium]|nr:MAG: type II toxin-antitoxin system VapC family toxin [Gammaproteobacteria bacterium]